MKSKLAAPRTDIYKKRFGWLTAKKSGPPRIRGCGINLQWYLRPGGKVPTCWECNFAVMCEVSQQPQEHTGVTAYHWYMEAPAVDKLVRLHCVEGPMAHLMTPCRATGVDMRTTSSKDSYEACS